MGILSTGSVAGQESRVCDGARRHKNVELRYIYTNIRFYPPYIHFKFTIIGYYLRGSYVLPAAAVTITNNDPGAEARSSTRR